MDGGRLVPAPVLSRDTRRRDREALAGAGVAWSGV